LCFILSRGEVDNIKTNVLMNVIRKEGALMIKSKNKVVSLILVAAMVLSMLPLGALTAFAVKSSALPETPEIAQGASGGLAGSITIEETATNEWTPSGTAITVKLPNGVTWASAPTVTKESDTNVTIQSVAVTTDSTVTITVAGDSSATDKIKIDNIRYNVAQTFGTGYVDVDIHSGDNTVTVQNADVQEGLVFAAAAKTTITETGNNNAVANVTLTEGSAGAIAKSKKITLTISTPGVTFSLAPAAAGTNSQAFTGPVIDNGNKATWTVSTASSGGASTITVSGIQYDIASSVAAGDIKIAASTDAGIAVTPTEVANAKLDTSGTIKVEATPLTITTGNGKDAANVTISESAAGAINPDDTLTVTLQNAVFYSAPVATGTGGIKFRESGKNVTTATGAQSSSTVYTWDVSAASTSPGTIVISNIKVNVASNASQDVKVQVSGAGITTKTVTVGSLSSTAKATISATSKPALKVNMPNQAGGDIVITESNAGALPTGTFVFLHVFDQIADSSALVTFGAKPSINVTDGNAEAGSAAYVSGTGLQDFQTIVFQVTNTSTAASTFKISGIKYDVTSKAINGDVIVDVRTNTTDSAAGFSSGTRLATVANATIGAATPTFSDVPATHYAFSAVEFLSNAGIINGRTSGLFDSNASITRGEFAKIICLAAGLPVTGGSASFSDTSGHWAAGYIEAAKTAGLIGGYPDGTFRPNNLITRAEIAKLVVLGAGFATASGAGFSDIATNWAKDYIMTASNNGIVNGYSDGTFRPNNSATRAEASVMVYNWLANK